MTSRTPLRPAREGRPFSRLATNRDPRQHEHREPAATWQPSLPCPADRPPIRDDEPEWPMIILAAFVALGVGLAALAVIDLVLRPGRPDAARMLRSRPREPRNADRPAAVPRVAPRPAVPRSARRSLCERLGQAASGGPSSPAASAYLLPVCSTRPVTASRMRASATSWRSCRPAGSRGSGRTASIPTLSRVHPRRGRRRRAPGRRSWSAGTRCRGPRPWRGSPGGGTVPGSGQAEQERGEPPKPGTATLPRSTGWSAAASRSGPRARRPVLCWRGEADAVDGEAIDRQAVEGPPLTAILLRRARPRPSGSRVPMPAAIRV